MLDCDAIETLEQYTLNNPGKEIDIFDNMCTSYTAPTENIPWRCVLHPLFLFMNKS